MVKFLYFKEDLYKENVNAILGKEPSSSLEILIDIKRGTTQELLYKIANVLNITDENVIKLIELSNKYKNIVEFVY